MDADYRDTTSRCLPVEYEYAGRTVRLHSIARAELAGVARFVFPPNIVLEWTSAALSRLDYAMKRILVVQVEN